MSDVGPGRATLDALFAHEAARVRRERADDRVVFLDVEGGSDEERAEAHEAARVARDAETAAWLAYMLASFRWKDTATGKRHCDNDRRSGS